MSERIEKLSPLKRALVAVEEMQLKLKKSQAEKNEPIAVIGMSGRFPKAKNLEEYWNLIINKQDGIVEVPKDRWDIEEYYDPTPSTPGKMISRYGGFIHDFDKFDAQFFGISPREAEKMDPQQRVLLEVSWEALEDAGIKISNLAGSKTGVFIGISTNDYSFVQYKNAKGDYTIIDAYQGSGNASSIAANRLSYFYDLQGPSISVDTACSSSLVSLHMACQSLKTRESNLALAGGVGLILSPHASITFSQAQMLSPDGKCKTFDSEANGYVRGEGAGIVILKRLSDAVADGDDILAVIKSSAVNQDGKTNGLTAPNSLSQVNVINEALRKAKLSPDQIGYIETHGTGTILGDPIEVQALGMVMKDSERTDKCYLGAVKSNIGHLEAAAGIAGFIKTVMVLNNKVIPPNANFNKINPHIPIGEIPLDIPTEPIYWQNGQFKRTAGVSSFGFGGTNAHIILQEADKSTKSENSFDRAKNILCLSANEESSLKEISKSYAEFILKNKDVALSDICYTTNSFRNEFPQKIAIPFESREELLECLTDYSNDEENFSCLESEPDFEKNKIAFLFTGQGSQHVNMAKDLYSTQPSFKQILDSCFEISDKYLSKSLKEIIFNQENTSSINETEFTQPALFVVEYSLAKFWNSLDIAPDYLIGHSIGEYAAACLSGVFTVEEGIRLTALRGSLMQSLPKNGEMVAIFGDSNKIESVIDQIDGKISIAGINGPSNVVISGDSTPISEALKVFDEQQIQYKKLVVSHAFHSELMAPILEEFEKKAAEINYQKPNIPLISNLTGKIVGDEICSPSYWSKHIREAVRFEEGMQQLDRLGVNVFIEVGPHPVLIEMGKKCIPQNSGLWLNSLKRNQNDWDSLLNSLGTLYVNGININWQEFDTCYNRSKVRLPKYQFNKERFYSDPKNGVSSNIVSSNIKDYKCIISRNGDEAENKLIIVNKNNEVILDLSGIDVDENLDAEAISTLLNPKTANESEAEHSDIKEQDEFSLSELKTFSDAEIISVIEKELRNELGKVLKLNAKRVDPNKSITHLGLDSIMAIELKNKLENKYEVNIPISELIKGPSINEISKVIATHINDEDDLVELVHIESTTNEFQLSYGQNAMWFQHQMAPASIFNPTYAIRIKDKLDIEKFKNCLNKIIERHSVLRSTYHFIDGKPKQIIHDSIKLPFEIHDCKELSDDEINTKVEKCANEIFDIENGPIFKTNLFLEGENSSIFLISSHHIAVDFWSQATIVNEINILYGNSEDVELKELNYTHTDFTEWQSKFLASDAGKKQLEYWEKKFRKEIPNLDLPTTYSRKPTQTFNGASLNKDFSLEQTENLKDICNKNNSTLYMLLFSLFKVLLNKYTHQNDIIIGTPTTGRSLSELKDIVGYFVNPIPIRTEIDASDSIIDILEKVKQNVLEGIANQDCPFNLVVEKVKPEREPSRSPMFQSMFVYQKAHVLSDEGLSGFAVGKDNASMNLGELPIESYILRENKSAFELTLLMAETSEGISSTITFNTDLFSHNFIKNFLDQFELLANIVTENPKIKISDISLVTEDEDKIESQKGNEFEFVHKGFERISKSYPHHTAVQFRNSKLTYSELNNEANQLANYLITKELAPESRIGVFVERSFEMIVSVLAVMKAGYVYVPIDTTYPEERIEHIINDGNIDVLISHKIQCDKLKQFDTQIICLDEERKNIADYSIENPSVKVDLLNLAYSIYTSGSTGKPKGVMLTHLGLSNLVKNQTEIFNISSESKVLQLASLGFDASVSEIFTALVNGATLNIVSEDILLSGSSLINELNDKQITVATIPPSLLAVIPKDKLSSLKTLVSAGEACTKDVISKWANGRKFVNAYGPTESTVCTTTYDIPSDIIEENIPVGSAINGIQVYILDKYMNKVPWGVNGELYIGGIGLARGYNNSPEMTAAKFLPNPFNNAEGERIYRSGDLVKKLENGQIEFVGRIDDQVKYRGFRIELGEVEAVLEDHSSVEKAVLLLKQIGNEKKLIAFYITNEDKEIDRNELRDYILERLPEYMLPTQFIKLDKIPLTFNGKVNKKELGKINVSGERKNEFEKPSTELEKEIVQIWKEVLGIDDISTNDNFFDLGGHSLNVIQVQSKIKEQFDKELTVVDLFKYPTVKMFSNFLVNGNNNGKKLEVVKERVDKQKNLLAQQQIRMRNRKK